MQKILLLEFMGDPLTNGQCSLSPGIGYTADHLQIIDHGGGRFELGIPAVHAAKLQEGDLLTVFQGVRVHTLISEMLDPASLDHTIRLRGQDDVVIASGPVRELLQSVFAPGCQMSLADLPLGVANLADSVLDKRNRREKHAHITAREDTVTYIKVRMQFFSVFFFLGLR